MFAWLGRLFGGRDDHAYYESDRLRPLRGFSGSAEPKCHHALVFDDDRGLVMLLTAPLDDLGEVEFKQQVERVQEQINYGAESLILPIGYAIEMC